MPAIAERLSFHTHASQHWSLLTAGAVFLGLLAGGGPACGLRHGLFNPHIVKERVAGVGLVLVGCAAASTLPSPTVS